MAENVKVKLAPQAGFCIKSSCLEDGVYNVPSSEEGPASTIPAPKGIKIFVNICFDAHVPPPPEGSEDIIRRVMRGENLPDLDGEEPQWFVPVVVSHCREDKDKGGKPSLVLDCVFHASIKDRMKDAEFKAFIFELALQRVEARSSIPLSRQIGTPNIRSKGSLLPRTVLIPPALYPPGHPQRSAFDAYLEAKKHKKLVEEIEPAQPPKGILKKTTTSHASTVSDEADASGEKEVPLHAELPAWTWSRDETGLKIKIQVPAVTRADIPTTTLDVEARRIVLSIPGRYDLDINLSLSDADIQAQAKTAIAAVNAAQTMALKRNPKDLDVDGARAEWRVADGLLVLAC